jgi:beta-ureidopropionase / N-carbamoyl-L-amino-acid hydrolase
VPSPRIDGARLWERLMALGGIGATGRGGVDRQALTDGEAIAWRQIVKWCVPHGLRVERDDASNLFLTLPGSDPSLPPVLAGSHIDTRPTGGMFDGAWGVLAALEAACAIVDAGMRPLRPLTVVAWMNRAGSRFTPGLMGSAVFGGARRLAEIRAVTDADGISVGEALDRRHGGVPLPTRPIGFPIAAYIEPHIEQGPVLEAAGLPIGIVTGIQGKKTWRVTLKGTKAHAGTADMASRHDAVAALALIVSALHNEVGTADALVKFTVGRVEVEPNAPSIVPGRASFSIDLRHPDNAALNRLGAKVEMLCTMLASPCTVDLVRLEDAPSLVFDAKLQDWIEGIAEPLGHGSMRLMSAAGHDARYLAPLAPTAMIFIPCRNGVSHAATEWAEPAHVAAGAEVLLAAVVPLLQS